MKLDPKKAYRSFTFYGITEMRPKKPVVAKKSAKGNAEASVRASGTSARRPKQKKS